MYLIDKNHNQISKIAEKRFSDLGFKEREHLQEWIAKNPSCLGEELLIIQKEFNGFDDTSERLDLLALDKTGNLVIIENKLDDSGRDVVWQALKYSSYCSSLKKSQILEIYQKFLQQERKDETAQENLIDFFGVQDLDGINLNEPQSQRIFFVAANFRKEVTSTVLWLMGFRLSLKCFKVIPYQKEDDLFLDINQIIPTKDSEDYTIKMAVKNQEALVDKEQIRERLNINQNFWNEFLEKSNENNNLFQNINGCKENWLWKSAGVSRIGYIVAIGGSYARVEFAISSPDMEKNKLIFDDLKKKKDEIEKKIGLNLNWERRDNRKSSAIKYELKDVDVYNKEDWGKMIEFMVENVEKFVNVFSKEIPHIKELIKE
jgi:hypothetical protein